ncbi:MAG: TIGR00153 family protein [Cellvibrionales bacterium]|nr:MAG: TIGR00153 family protein [Cellvibrionales bacterium]
MAINNPLYKILGRSPIKPMQQHMGEVVTCVKLLGGFFTASNTGDWQQASKVYDEICASERQADELKKQIRLHLPKSLFMPMPRTDLLDLVTTQDRIANGARDIAGLMLGRNMVIPESIQNDGMAFLKTAIAATEQAFVAINELDELLETGFGDREVSFIATLIEALDRLEHENDQLEQELRKKLFALEVSLPPVEVMFLYKIIDIIGEMADDAERVGARLQLLLAR